MQPEERQFVLDHLGSSQAHLLALTDPLSPAQWHFHESPERWSIADNIEHCILVEQAITRVLAAALAAPAQPEKKAAAPAKETLLKSAATPAARARHLKALDAVQPTGRWDTTGKLLAAFAELRARSIHYVQASDTDLRSHFMPHQALGDLDGYQWLIVMALHGERHAAQIEEIKRHPAFPA